MTKEQSIQHYMKEFSMSREEAEQLCQQQDAIFKRVLKSAVDNMEKGGGWIVRG
jgi:hypothetical protein